ncbi:MAG: hypothetical protein ACFCD0_02690 [Gemmataceae bacterium]
MTLCLLVEIRRFRTNAGLGSSSKLLTDPTERAFEFFQSNNGTRCGPSSLRDKINYSGQGVLGQTNQDLLGIFQTKMF